MSQTEEADEASFSGRSVSDAGLLSGPKLKPSQFVAQVARLADADLQAAGLHFQVQTRGRLVKFWSGDDASVHYEVWVHEREARLEIGFHMEADAALNTALYREFDKCLLDLQVQLGAGVWLEPWDRGWVRLYETQPLWPLDRGRVYDTAERVVAFAKAVEPVYQSILVKLQEQEFSTS
ncbi:MAG: hypothetical protein M3437_04190 [Chloroflexota bacterium]|nr:hypothetical protein [Chloroflexota bacterium]MDQ5864224.1 hypothetical protein [Chloroflexota bacterium]